MTPEATTSIGSSTLRNGALAICGAVFAFAFVAAPHACAWGLTAYFLLGAAALIALFAAPLALQRDRPPLKRVMKGFALFAVGFAVWVGGIFAANMQLLCRLF